MKRVFLQFSFRQGWFCQFLEEDRKTPLPRTVLLCLATGFGPSVAINFGPPFGVIG